MQCFKGDGLEGNDIGNDSTVVVEINNFPSEGQSDPMDDLR